MITAQQRDAATHPQKVVGSVQGQALFLVMISPDALSRAQELSTFGGTPPWQLMDMSRAGNIPISTIDPVWFLELEDKIRQQRAGVVVG
jgi:hypothetical protein